MEIYPVDTGQFYKFNGDYSDVFIVLINWRGDVVLYHQDGEVLRYMAMYESVFDLLTAYPAFEINPEILSKKYMALKYPLAHTTRYNR
jgi:hypothetical protein